MICLEKCEKNEIIKTCNNKHIFCKKCLHDYIETIDENNDILCPCCRNKIDYKTKEDDINIINNMKEGVFCSYYRNGKLKTKCNYVNDKLEGLYESYYKNGNKFETYNYENNVIKGLYTKYYDNKQIWKSCIFINGNIGKYDYVIFTNNSFHEYKDVYGSIEEFIEEWYYNGIKKYKCNYIEGLKEGCEESWYENGLKKYRCNYKKGLKEGYEDNWYENGVKKEESFYVNNKRTGLHKKWNIEGEVISEDLYKNDKKITFCKCFYF